MNFVTDTNIIFSAILNPKSSIGQIILNGSKYFTFLSVDLLRNEIDKHEDKILKVSGLSRIDYLIIYRLIISKIKFVNQLLITPENYHKADLLTRDIDPNDLLFVGLSIQLDCKLWTGDKKLFEGLTNKNFNKVITTDELFQKYLYQKLKSRKK